MLHGGHADFNNLQIGLSPTLRYGVASSVSILRVGITQMKNFIAIVAATFVLAPSAHAQSAADLTTIGTACAVDGAACVAAIRAFRASPAFLTLPPAQRVAALSVVATQVQATAVANRESVAVRASVVAGLAELQTAAIEENAPNLAENIQTAAAAVADEENDLEEVPVGSFSDN